MTRLLHSLAITTFCLWPMLHVSNWMLMPAFFLVWADVWLTMVLFFSRFDLNEYDLPEGY